MVESLIDILRCPVTKTTLALKIIKVGTKLFDGKEVEVIDEGILFSDSGWFYPIINGIPRFNIESPFEYAIFLKQVMPDYDEKIIHLNTIFGSFIKTVQAKTIRTRKSFSKEWSMYDYNADKTWGADAEGMLALFLRETNETLETLKGKVIFDAGCGNGALNSIVAGHGITTIAMDFSNSVERAYNINTHSCVHYLQGNVQFPPVAFNSFDIVHSSGVLIATNNTELSFSCIEPLVKKGGKLSVWLYHKRDNFIHNTFNVIRQKTSKLPLGLQHFFYKGILFPITYVVKKLKGNKQNNREMMVDIFDWFSPEFRWEHDHKEAEIWFLKRNYSNIKVTTTDMFGFSIIGDK